MKVQNPLFCADMPDMDVIRAGLDFYMVSTTMFYMPAAPILKSRDLVHWEIVSYICNEIADNDIYRLENGRHAYGKGQWATSLMQYKGRFYACFVCHDMKKTYLFSTDDIEKSNWNRTELDAVYHDMSFLCWEDHVYLVYGNGDIRIVELNPELTGVVEGSDRLLLSTPSEGIRLRCEGCRAYVKDGWIYLLFIDWPADTESAKGKRREVCYRSRSLMGPYECKVILEDDMWLPDRGVAQGPLFSDADGNWYAMMFQDSGAIGRVPFLMTVRWVDGWPVLGENGRVPECLDVPFEEVVTEEVIQNDGFAHSENELKKVWQWNHSPDHTAWSFTERPGYLRLHNKTKAEDLMEARNTLTQRTKAPYSEFTVCLDSSQMKDGDFAGLCVLLEKYGQIGVRRKNGNRQIVLLYCDKESAPADLIRKEGHTALKGRYQIKEYAENLGQDQVWLRVIFRFDSWKTEKETAEFFYSLDGMKYRQLGEPLELFYSLSVFVGARIGIFSYNDERTKGGCSDFRDFVFRDREA